MWTVRFGRWDYEGTESVGLARGPNSDRLHHLAGPLGRPRRRRRLVQRRHHRPWHELRRARYDDLASPGIVRSMPRNGCRVLRRLWRERKRHSYRAGELPPMRRQRPLPIESGGARFALPVLQWHRQSREDRNRSLFGLPRHGKGPLPNMSGSAALTPFLRIPLKKSPIA
jgi:hypothetical protein